MKRLLVLFVVLFTVFFSYTIIAQEMGAARKGIAIYLPGKIQTPLGPPLAAGTYTVGTGGYFPTIDSAFKKLSIDGVAGAVTLELINTLYVAPTDSFGFKLVGPIPGAGPTSRLTIKPAANKNVVVEGGGGTTFYLLNTSYVTFDGVSLTGATTLTIHSLQNSVYIWNDGIDFMNNSDHNVMQNIIFINEDNTRASGSGFWYSQVGPVAPDSNLIQNNLVKKAGVAFYFGSPYASVKGKANIIRGNKIGSATDSLIADGIEVDNCQNTIIENNLIQNLKVTLGGTAQYKFGINVYYGFGDIIRNNVVGNLRANSGFTCTGIILSGDTNEMGNSHQVYNNMIYDIQSTSTAGESRVAGIQMWQQNSPKIYYNTVYLSGSGSNNLGSAALYTYDWGNCTNIDVRNNILINTRNESTRCASSIWISPGTSIATSNYNDLYYSPSIYNCTVRMYGTNYTTLSDWQSTGKDLNSVTEMPHFALTDLHINWGYATLIDGHATPIAGITTDFDGEPRNALTPDIGADEGVVVPVELTSFTASANGAEVILNWSTATELNNYGFEIQRKAFDGDFATVAFVRGQGTTTQQNQYSFLDKNLDEGKYSYRLKQVDFSGTFEYSKTIEVEVSPVLVYSLEQNYPNPFNPSTTISYGLKEKRNAKLTILNTLGEEVALLVNEEQDKGYHKVEFDGSKLSSGVYFCKLAAGNFISTRKMLLLK